MRHRQRHVHATIHRHLRTGLTELDWVNPPINFGATKITLLDYEPQQAGVTPPPNTVAVSIESQGDNREAELGGMQSVRYTLFIDIYGENEPVAIALADDVKDLIVDEQMPVLNFNLAADGEETDLWLEFESVLVEAPASAASTLDKRTWRAVKAFAVCYF